VPIVLKCGSPNLLEPSGPVQACNGIALPLHFYEAYNSAMMAIFSVFINYFSKKQQRRITLKMTVLPHAEAKGS